MNIYLEQTSIACPEQYEAYDGQGNQIGYLRLRHGEFMVEYPEVNGEIIYEEFFEEDLKGAFDDIKERDYYLNQAKEAIRKKIK